MPLASTAAISRSSGRSFFSLLDKSWGVISARLAGFGGSPHLLSAQTKTAQSTRNTDPQPLSASVQLLLPLKSDFAL